MVLGLNTTTSRTHTKWPNMRLR